MAPDRIPYGYRMEKGNYMIDHDEAKIIRAIFTMKTEGIGVYAIGKALFEQQVPFFSDSRDKAIKKVSAILYKPIYAGEKGYPAIVSRELFDCIMKQKPSAFRKAGAAKKTEAEHTEKLPEIEYEYCPDKEIETIEVSLRSILAEQKKSSAEIRESIMALAAKKYDCIRIKEGSG